jgi:cellulose synthase/poly-beta-1,6-N-acetylglucosamine synthase-like glycosyltransferase
VTTPLNFVWAAFLSPSRYFQQRTRGLKLYSTQMSVRFSVLLPVYNRENYVREAVDSVLNQTFTDFELLVIDDGSTDRSLEILKSYGSKLKLIQQRNQGPG